MCTVPYSTRAVATICDRIKPGAGVFLMVTSVTQGLPCLARVKTCRLTLCERHFYQCGFLFFDNIVT